MRQAWPIASLSGCRRSGSDSGFAVVSWAYGHTVYFSWADLGPGALLARDGVSSLANG